MSSAKSISAFLLVAFVAVMLGLLFLVHSWPGKEYCFLLGFGAIALFYPFHFASKPYKNHKDVFKLFMIVNAAVALILWIQGWPEVNFFQASAGLAALAWILSELYDLIFVKKYAPTLPVAVTVWSVAPLGFLVAGGLILMAGITWGDVLVSVGIIGFIIFLLGEALKP